MSSGPENTYIRSVHRHLPVEVYVLKNHNVYAAGVADCWYSAPGGDCWIEYKFIQLPTRPQSIIDFCDTKKKYSASCLQQEWLTARHREGRRVGVVVGSTEGGLWLPGILWQQSITAEYFRHHMVDRKTIASRIVRFATPSG